MLASCGYHFEDRDYSDQVRTTINVPYVKGDIQGEFTNALIHELSHSGQYEYVRDGGALTLKLSLVADTTSKIGYRYDRKNQTCILTNHLQPTEGRREVTVELSLFDELSQMEIIKPTLIRGSSEFDFVGTYSLCDLSFINNGRRVTVSSFSLGQLDSVEGAQDDTAAVLYRDLSQKIVNGMINATNSFSSAY